jgi:plasmid stability protein
MSQSITLKLPDEVDRALQIEAARSGRSPEQVALEWIESNIAKPTRGSAEALLLSHGAWSMTPDEQARIERLIEEDRLLEEHSP